jgi:dipeptidase E
VRGRFFYNVMSDVMNFGYRELMDLRQFGRYAWENGFDIVRAGSIKAHKRPRGEGAMSRLLLLSNSMNPGGRYLRHARAAIKRFLGRDGRNALLVPYAGVRIDWDEYHPPVAEALAPVGVRVRSIHHARDPRRAVAECSAVFVGGGNTWHLLDLLQASRPRARHPGTVAAGAPYMGWSAGSNVACPTIRTTNDMPIVAPRSLDALGLVPFQINPHYTEARLRHHGGESRVDRLREFCTANPRPCPSWRCARAAGSRWRAKRPCSAGRSARSSISASRGARWPRASWSVDRNVPTGETSPRPGRRV